MGKKRPTTNCHNCGKECRLWVFFGMEQDATEHHYCSQKCHDEHRKTWETTCRECGYRAVKSKYEDGHWRGFSGVDVYCSEECYLAQFIECNVCHKKNLTVKYNMNRSGVWYPDLPDQICDDCYNKKQGWVSVRLEF